MTDLDGAYDPDADAKGADFGPIPAGIYTMRIISAERRPVSKTRDCGDHLNITWKVEGGDFDGRLVWQTINLWWERSHESYDKVIKIANSQFAMIREATGVHMPKNTDELLERPCKCHVKIKAGTGNYQDRNEVWKVEALGAAPSRAPAASPAPAAAKKKNVFQKAKEAQSA